MDRQKSPSPHAHGHAPKNEPAISADRAITIRLSKFIGGSLIFGGLAIEILYLKEYYLDLGASSNPIAFLGLLLPLAGMFLPGIVLQGQVEGLKAESSSAASWVLVGTVWSLISQLLIIVVAVIQYQAGIARSEAIMRIIVVSLLMIPVGKLLYHTSMMVAAPGRDSRD